MKTTYYKTVPLFILSFAVYANQTLRSQNIFDLNHSYEYADFLSKSVNINEAISEYERITDVFTENDSIKIHLINLYIKTEQFQKATEFIKNEYGNDYASYSENIINLYIHLLFLTDNYSEVSLIINSSCQLKQKDKDTFLFALKLIQMQTNTELFIDSLQKFYFSKNKDLPEKFTVLEQEFNHFKQIKQRNPIFASVLSTIIPGSGKIYSNDKQNGFKVFTIIGLNGFQSFRAFSKVGKTSFYGWSFGMLAGGFYLGNILGAYESAERENHYQFDLFRKKIIQIIIN